MSSALQAKKRKEAEENLKQADKYLAKTMLRWNPDYLAAAPHLEKAADAFRAAGDYDTAKRVFTQAASVQIKNKSSFRAAQNYENVAKVALQQLRDARATGADKLALLAEVRKAFDAASSHYGDMGELGKAADALLKAAASCDEHASTDSATAVALKDLYLRACALVEAQDKPHFAVEPFRKALSFCIKSALYSDALAVLARLVAIFQQIDQPANVHKLYVSELVLRLATGDVAAADQAYMRQLQDDAFLAADECALADDLVRAFKTGSEELLQATVKKQGFSFLDNQVARLARKLTIYGGGGGSVAAAVPGRTQPQQPRNEAAPSKPARANPFAPPTAPLPAPTPAPLPAPVPVSVPVSVPVVHPSAEAPAPVTAFADATDDYDFDDTTARATLAMPSDALGVGALSFDFDSLEFEMPVEDDASTSHATSAHEAASSPMFAATEVAPVATGRQPPAPVDDDMFDLT